MKTAAWVAFRQITSAEFFETSKPYDPVATGGKQSYIDLAGMSLPVTAWQPFFQGAPHALATHNLSKWTLPMRSLGQTGSQNIVISYRGGSGNTAGQPRNLSVRSQKIHSGEANRVHAWHPAYTNFPDLPAGVGRADPQIDTLIKDLTVYIIRTDNGEFWAGFFQATAPKAGWICDPRLMRMFTQDEGLIELKPGISFDENNAAWPFEAAIGAAAPVAAPQKLAAAIPAPLAKTEKTKKSEAELISALMDDDEEFDDNAPPNVKEQTKKVRVRNKKAAENLRQLYKQCQITAHDFTFVKTNGDHYTEVHHLIPLGKGGADAPHNLVVVSAHIHRMLHYAHVTGLDLKNIKDDKLEIKINDKPYTITWHPQHAKLILDAETAAA